MLDLAGALGEGSPSFHSDALKDGKEIKWPDAVYPDLHMPFAPSWSLHWAYRDGHLVNLPVSLLVEGDIIALRPGQESFASLRGIKVAQDFSFPGNAAGESTGSSGRAPSNPAASWRPAHRFLGNKEGARASFPTLSCPFFSGPQNTRNPVPQAHHS